MDYQNDVPYTTSCKEAAHKGIVINAIKLGGVCKDATEHFKAMAACSNGAFLTLSQDAKDVVINSPYDQEIKDVSFRIEHSKVYYGTAQEQTKNNFRKTKAIGLYSKSSMNSTNERSRYNMSKSGKSNWFGTNELIEDVNSGKVKVESIKKEQLPEELKGKSEVEIVVIIKQKSKERKSEINQLRELSKKRDAFIKEAKLKNSGDESFSNSINKLILKQKSEVVVK